MLSVLSKLSRTKSTGSPTLLGSFESAEMKCTPEQHAEPEINRATGFLQHRNTEPFHNIAGRCSSAHQYYNLRVGIEFADLRYYKLELDSPPRIGYHLELIEYKTAAGFDKGDIF